MKSPVNASHQVAPAVSTVEMSRMRLCPTMSPSFARNGTTIAESSSWAASNQLKSASLMPRCSTRSGMSGT